MAGQEERSAAVQGEQIQLDKFGAGVAELADAQDLGTDFGPLQTKDLF